MCQTCSKSLGYAWAAARTLKRKTAQLRMRTAPPGEIVLLDLLDPGENHLAGLAGVHHIEPLLEIGVRQAVGDDGRDV